MKRLSDYISPIGSLFVAIAVYVPIIILLRPSLIEFLIMFGVDTLSLLLVRPIERKVFEKFYPLTAFYINGLDFEKFGKLSFAEKIELVQSMMSFPRQRANYLYIQGFVKVIPPILVIVFLWKHNTSHLMQAVKIGAITFVVFCYYYGSVFIESHMYLSNLIRELQSKFDLSDVFSKVKISYSKYEIQMEEFLVLFFIIVFMISLQITIVSTRSTESNWELSIQILLTSIIGLSLFTRIWYIGRKYFIGALEEIFDQMQGDDFLDKTQVLALHSSALLAQFDKTYNFLRRRLMMRERELSSLVLHESEKSRFRTLGEVSALIAHDLSGPLHSAHFFASELLENSDHPKRQEYVKRLTLNMQRALELINSLRARLKNSSNENRCASFLEAHKHVIQFLEIQFGREEMRKVQIVMDQEISQLKLNISSVDLIHVLDNLYRNSLQNLLLNKIQEPKISIRFSRVHSSKVVVTVSDNGTGLQPERFEKLTALTELDQEASRQGLGLKLIRKLVELNGGTLRVLDPESGSGSTFCLEFNTSMLHEPEGGAPLFRQEAVIANQ